jgi:hypothetical protein
VLFSSNRPLTLQRLAYRAAAMFFAGGVAAYCLAPSDAPRPAPAANAQASADEAEKSVNQRIQEFLAQGGCPGWIALANEPELLDGAVKPAALLSGTAGIEPSSTDQALMLVQLPPVDDELISEQEDLLFTSPEVRGAAKTTPSEPPATAPPAETPLPAITPPDDPASPSDEPETPTVSTAPVEQPADPPQPATAPAPSESTADDLIPESDDLLAPGDSGAEQPTSSDPGESAPADSGPSEGSPPASVQSPAQPETTDAAPADTLPAPSASSAEELLNDRDDLLDRGAAPQPTRPLVPPATRPQVVTPPAGSAPPAAPPTGAAAPKKPADAVDRCEFVAKSLYPAATECRACHEKIYEEWSVSSHAYSFVSPMFHKFEQKINDIASGTIGYFCYRCHTPAGTSLGISRAAPYWNAPQVAREGVTCVACHRVREFYGKTNGERRVEPGDIHAPVWGTIGGDGVAAVAANKGQYKVHTAAADTGPGIDMHASAQCMPQLAESEFCASCHQVAVYPGIKLEVVWEQYRASPACKKGVKCQECHMGRIPGVPSGYEFGPAALINNKSVVANRRHSNHTFYGPGYSIAHPGVFPFNPKAERWSVHDWLLFDWRAGWGTDKFEDAVEYGQIRVTFPDVWKEADDRFDAREIIEANLKKKDVKNRLRAQVMENGSHVDGPFFETPPRAGQELKFAYVVVNTNDGHNLPTASLGAQPQLWANVALIGPRGNRLWETGYLDSHGDLADIHSEDVRNKRLTYDWQLFNLQTMFLITGAKGTDREFFLPVNIDIDPLPFIRPQAQPVAVLNHPPFIRMEARSLAPLGSRRVPYRIPAHLLCEPGRYRLSFRMRNRTEPPYFMRFCESTPEMQRAMLEGTLDFHESSVEFDVR